MTDNKFIKIYNDVNRYNTIQSVANALGLSERTVRRTARRLKDDGNELIDRKNIGKINNTSISTTEDLQTQLTIRKLQDNLTSLKKQLKEAHKEVSTSQVLRDLIHEYKDSDIDSVPDWISPKAKHVEGITGIPVLFLSDIHFDEVVSKAQIGGVNEFNRVIAEDRLKHTFETARDLLTYYMKDAKYDGFVLALGGDMVSGNIHEELAENNETPILQTVVRLSEILISGIEMLVEEFDKIFIPCIVGNHGRLHQKKRHKNRVFDNYEWIMYQYIKKHFANDDRITVHVPDSVDTQFSIYNTRFLLEHGDNYRGGGGIAGIFSPLMLGAHKKNKNKNAVGNPFDIMMLGHFHQYIHTNSLIVNGSVKGMDEYAYNNNFPYEPPQQALFVVHPVYGVTYRMPVRCDGYALTDDGNYDKIKIVF